MARRKIKKPTLTQEVAGLTISTNLMKRELVDLSPKISHLSGSLNSIRSSIDSVHSNVATMRSRIDHAAEIQNEQAEKPLPFTTEQFNQLAAAVNKIAAYAAAMDETKKTMIRLTSKRINKLDARVSKLRVRLKRLT